jgi:uncharacterized membrane protein YhhN
MELKFLLLIILGAVSLVYLITLFFKDSILQYILKGCLVPLILAIYIFGAPQNILPLIVIALVFGWLGDVFLLKISNLLCFRLGLASFLLGHIFYIITMFNYVQPVNILILIISIIAAVCYGIFMFKMVQPSPDMKIPVIAYEIILLTMAVSALQLFLAQGGRFGAFVFAGSIFFVASDSMLALATFRKKALNVPVMITYIAAQLLIVLGFGGM